MTIRVSSNDFHTMRSQARETYPEECCGILVGKMGDLRWVKEAIPTKNTRDDYRSTRYTIDPKQIWHAEKKYEKEGVGVIGFYHSHPDAPARPSSFDLENAWPMYSYVIVSVARGEPETASSWVLANDRSSFLQEELVLEQ